MGFANGINNGNQENIPSLCVWGTIEIWISLYNADSKVPDNPWIVTAICAVKESVPNLQ
jgi:hypothetical protein